MAYVKDYLNRHAVGHEFQQSSEATLRFTIRLPATTAVDLANFIEEKRLRGQTRLGTGDQVRCEFVNKIGGTSGGVERISQFHPLVRFISKKISKNDEGFFPVVAVKFPSDVNDTGLDLPNGQYVFVIRKWEFVGLRAEADLYARVIHLESDLEVSTGDSWNLLNAVRLDGSDWPEAVTEAHPDRLAKLHVCFDYLETEFQKAREIKENENADRVNFQILLAQRYRDRQVDSLQKVLDNYISRSQTRMIPATKARIEKITTRFDVKIEQLKSREIMTARNLLVCCGILLLK